MDIGNKQGEKERSSLENLISTMKGFDKMHQWHIQQHLSEDYWIDGPSLSGEKVKNHQLPKLGFFRS